MDAFRLPEEALQLGWEAVEDAAAARGLAEELAREMPAGHRLAGVAVRAAARGPDEDDVLFALPDGRFAVVHLTWNRETDSQWPWTVVHETLEAFVSAERT